MIAPSDLASSNFGALSRRALRMRDLRFSSIVRSRPKTIRRRPSSSGVPGIRKSVTRIGSWPSSVATWFGSMSGGWDGTGSDCDLIHLSNDSTVSPTIRRGSEERSPVFSARGATQVSPTPPKSVVRGGYSPRWLSGCRLPAPRMPLDRRVFQADGSHRIVTNSGQWQVWTAQSHRGSTTDSVSRPPFLIPATFWADQSATACLWLACSLACMTPRMTDPRGIRWGLLAA